MYFFKSVFSKVYFFKNVFSKVHSAGWQVTDSSFAQIVCDHHLRDHSGLDSVLTPLPCHFLSLCFFGDTKVDLSDPSRGWTGSCQGGICDHLQSGVLPFTTKHDGDDDPKIQIQIQMLILVKYKQLSFKAGFLRLRRPQFPPDRKRQKARIQLQPQGNLPILRTSPLFPLPLGREGFPTVIWMGI